jgi:hypothetical protein
MNKISASQAEDLLSKLLEEHVPVRMYFLSPSGLRVFMRGFVDSKTVQHGVFLRLSKPPIDPDEGFVQFRPFDRNCEFSYGEVRELPPEVFETLTGPVEESALTMRFPDFGEIVVLFFTV